jgi:hypothetical protein
VPVGGYGVTSQGELTANFTSSGAVGGGYALGHGNTSGGNVGDAIGAGSLGDIDMGDNLATVPTSHP